MRFEDIIIQDFGCFQNARIESLSDGLAVIAGPQRAGKTTFLHAVRQLPYSVQRGGNLPPALNTYELGATVHHEGQQYGLQARGYADTQIITPEESATLTREELVGDLTREQYRQLFTLSLDELRQMPAGIESKGDLSEILLGAAYGNISEVPSLRDELSSEAYSIGAKYGKNTVSELKDPKNAIETAVEERDAAKRTVDEYGEKQGELADLETALAEFDSEEKALRVEQTRLNILEKRFGELEHFEELTERLESADTPEWSFQESAVEQAEALENDLADAREIVEDTQEELASYTTDESHDLEEFQSALLSKKAELEVYEGKVELWKGTESTIERRENEVDGERRELKQRVANLRADWETLDAVRSATVDTFTKEDVRRITSEVESLRGDVEETQGELKAKKQALQSTSDDLEKAEEAIDAQKEGAGDSSGLKVGGGIAIAGVVIGAAVGLATTPLVGYVIAGLGIAVGFYYANTQLGGAGDAVDVTPVRELRMEKSNKKSEVRELEKNLEEKKAQLQEAEAAFGDLCSQFDLPNSASPDGVREFFDELHGLKGDIQDYDTSAETLEDDVQEFETTLDEAATVVSEIQPIEWDSTAPRATTEELYAAVKRLTEAVKVAEDLETATDAYAQAQDDVLELVEPWAQETRDGDWQESLSETLEAYAEAAETAEEYHSTVQERDDIRRDIRREFAREAAREAFIPIAMSLGLDGTGEMSAPEAQVDSGTTAEDQESVPEIDGAETGVSRELDIEQHGVALLQAVADEYPTRGELETRLVEISERKDEIQEQKEELRENRAELKEELKTLASDEDIKEAEADIQRHRETLQRRAEEYATNRLGEFILDRLHDRFIERATGPLLDQASDIFARITEAYDGIDQEGELDSLDFVAEQLDGSAQETQALSRATREQLFLSVRLARIRQLDVKLPVVLDDAMTNFDPAHTRRTLAFLDELARTNQVIILTCHPQFAEIAAEQATVENFWCLDQGQFSGPHDDLDPVYEVLDARSS